MSGRIATLVGAVSIGMLPIAPATVSAQSGGGSPCACLVASAGAASGMIVATSGDVLMSLPAGFGPARRGAVLSTGSRVIVGPTGAASIAFGPSCALDLKANSTAQISARNGNLCVRVADRSASATSPRTTSSVMPVVLGGVAAGTAVAVGIGLSHSASH